MQDKDGNALVPLPPVSNMSTIVFSVTNTEEYSGGYYYRAGHVDAASKSEYADVSLSHMF